MTQYTARAFRPSTVSPGDGSRTITITPTPAQEGRDAEDIINPEQGGSGSTNPEDRRGEGGGGTVGALKLRAGKKSGAKVAWGEDVIDNEGCGKKKSKICCIYHKSKRFDESSDESESDTDSDSSCNHDHANGGEGTSSRPDGGGSAVHRMDDGYSSEPNAYERMPNWKGKGKGKHKANENA